MNTELTHEQLKALAAMVELGQQDRSHYLVTYAEENEETPDQIAAGHRQVELASEALAVLRGDSGAPVEASESSIDDVEDDGPGHLLTVSVDFRVTGDADSIREPLARTVSDLLEDGTNDGIFSIPGSTASFLSASAEVTACYREDEE